MPYNKTLDKEHAIENLVTVKCKYCGDFFIDISLEKCNERIEKHVQSGSCLNIFVPQLFKNGNKRS